MNWEQILAPLISALVLGLAGLATVVLTGLGASLKRWFDARGLAAEGQATVAALTVVSTAQENSAGRLADRIRTGELDPLDAEAMKRAVTAEAETIARRVPDAIALLKPVGTAIADGVLGKLGRLRAAGEGSALVASLLPAAQIAAVPKLAAEVQQ